MRFAVIDQLGTQRVMTPKGLLCKDAVLARTGEQEYGPYETPIEPGAFDRVIIERPEDEVFAPETIASAEWAPVVNDHPLGPYGDRLDVNAENWRDLACGWVINPHRGSGLDSDLLVGDLLIPHQATIDAIDGGKRELSCGYDADYEEIAPGRGVQRNIRINHVALVDRGRCGPRCCIGDADWNRLQADARSEELAMARANGTKQPTWRERLRAAFKARDESEFEEAIGAAPTGDNDEPGEEERANGESHVHVHLDDRRAGDQEGEGVAAVIGRHDDELEELWQANQMEQAAIESLLGGGGEATDRIRDRIRDAKFPHRDARRKRMGIDTAASDQGGSAGSGFRDPPDVGAAGGTSTPILPGFEMEAPPGTQVVDLQRARDSALLEDAHAETMAAAEILLPGVKLPVFDRAQRPARTIDALCRFRREVLGEAHRRDETRALVERDLRGRDLAKLPCELVRDAFFRVAEARAAENHRAAGFGGTLVTAGLTVAGPVASPADIEKMNADYWRGKA